MTTNTPDLVNHPPHYKSHPSGIECIQITEHLNFNLGNAIKYIWRAGLKSKTPIEDLRKARWYIEREIKRLTTSTIPPIPIITLEEKIRDLQKSDSPFPHEGNHAQDFILDELLKHFKQATGPEES